MGITNRKYKRKFKLTGLRKIQRVLHKYYPKRYLTYTGAKERAIIIKQQMNGERYTVSNILSYERKKREKKVVAPELNSKLLGIINYFDLVEYPKLILSTDSRIVFRSKLFEGELRGGEHYLYLDFFKDFVHHCDLLRKREIIGESSYEVDWYVRCGELQEDKEVKGQWISEIYSCDKYGQREDYGFDVFKHKLTEEELSDLNKGKNKSNTNVLKDKNNSLDESLDIKNKELDNEKLRLELEILKERNKSDVMELYKSGVIDKVELRKMLGL